MTHKLFTLMLAIMASVGTIYADIVNGSCGTNLTWTLNTETGVLTISGTGEMTNYKFESNIAPWWVGYASSIKQIVLEEGITRIGNSAFQACSQLTTTTITIPNSVVTIGEQAFYGCNVTQVIIPNGITHIEARAFYGSGLTSLDIPASVTTIEGQAFYNCGKMTAIHVDLENPNYKDIDGVLYNKEGTNFILYPIGKTAESYTIPDETIYIGDYAFAGCKNVLSVMIPNNVTTIGNNAFASCTKLASIIIPNHVTTIGNYAFENCSKLTSLEIPNSVISIGDRAFFNCVGLTSLQIGSGVSNIGYQAFIHCSAITSIISFSMEPPTLGVKAFNGVDNTVCELYVPSNSIEAYRAADQWSAFSRIHSVEDIPSEPQYIADGTCGAEGNESNVTWTLSFDSVLTISGNGAMKNYSYSNPWYLYRNSIKSVVIKGNVTNIPDYAFHNCSNLISVAIPNSVTSIGQSAFYYCYSLPSVDIPSSVTSIGMMAFEECNSLTTIDIPNGVTMLDYCVFEKCQNLQTVTIPASLTEIRSATFRNCPKLLGIVVDADNPNYSSSNGVLYSKDGCTLIQYTAGRSGNVKIPQQVTIIGSEAFRYCEKLTSITIPESVIFIGYQAFSECFGLQYITCKATTPPALEMMEMNDEMFYGIKKNIPLYVPSGCVDAYRADMGWQYFTNILEEIDDAQSFSISYLDKNNGFIDSEYVKLHVPEPPTFEGFTFLRWDVVAGQLAEGINIQAVYTANTPTSAPSVYTNPANPAQKLIREGNVYILKGENTYTLTGQIVK